MSPRTHVIAKQLACPVAAALLFGGVLWRQWPIGASTDDIGTLAYALLAVGMVLCPDAVATYTVGPLFSQSSMSGKGGSVLDDADLIRVVGFVLLFDALTGWGKWLVWTWW